MIKIGPFWALIDRKFTVDEEKSLLTTMKKFKFEKSGHVLPSDFLFLAICNQKYLSKKIWERD